MRPLKLVAGACGAVVFASGMTTLAWGFPFWEILPMIAAGFGVIIALFGVLAGLAIALEWKPEPKPATPVSLRSMLGRMNRSEAFLDFAGMAAMMAIYALIALWSPGMAYEHANRAIRDAYGPE